MKLKQFKDWIIQELFLQQWHASLDWQVSVQKNIMEYIDDKPFKSAGMLKSIQQIQKQIILRNTEFSLEVPDVEHGPVKVQNTGPWLLTQG